MIRMIQNESIKIFRQTGYKVLMIILLVVALLIPCVHFGGSMLIELLDSGWATEEEYEFYTEMAEEYENSEEPWKIIEGAVNRGYAEVERFFIDNDMYGTWRESYYKYDLRDKNNLLQLYRLLASGKVKYGDMSDSGYGWEIENALLAEGIGVEEVYGDSYYDDEIYYETVFNPSLVDWKAVAAKQQETVDALKEEILTVTAKDILASSVAAQEQEILDTEAVIAEAEAALKLMEQQKNDIGEEFALDCARAQYDLDLLRAKLESEREALWAYNFLSENECDPDSWQYRMVTQEYLMTVDAYNRDMVPMPEVLWEDQKSFLDGDYEDYLESLEEDSYTIYLRDTVAVGKYALEHDIVPADYADEATKSYFHNYISIYMSVVSIFVIVLMGMIVASEYSSGTIRLLVIRPRKRHKILTSKLVAALMYCFALSFAGMLIMVTLGTLFFGFGDSFEADIFVNNGHAFAIPAVLTFVAEIVLILLGILFRASIALFFSAVTKKAALAIVIPMVINTYASTAQLLSIGMGELLPFIKFTILPYLSPEILLSRPMATGGSLTTALYGGSLYGSVASLGAIYGIVLVALHVFVIVLGTYLIFNRQQIKN